MLKINKKYDNPDLLEDIFRSYTDYDDFYIYNNGGHFILEFKNTRFPFPTYEEAFYYATKYCKKKC